MCTKVAPARLDCTTRTGVRSQLAGPPIRGAPMHTVIRRYRLDDGDLDEVMHRIDTAFADGLAREPGFVAYECLRTAPDGLTTISTFTNESGCERSNRMAGAFVRDELSDMTIRRIGSETGPATVSRAAREVLEPA